MLALGGGGASNEATALSPGGGISAETDAASDEAAAFPQIGAETVGANRERELVAVWLVARTGWLQDGQLMQLLRRLQGDELMQGSPHRLYQSLYQSLLARVVRGSTASLPRRGGPHAGSR